MNKSGRLIVHEVCVTLHGVINSTMLLIYLFQCSLFCVEIFERAKVTSRWSHKKIL